jgi:plastocyanin
MVAVGLLIHFGASRVHRSRRLSTRRIQMKRRVLMFGLVVLALGFGLAACGGGDDEGNGDGGGDAGGGGGGGAALALAADPGGDLAFDKTALEATAGEVTIDLTNEASIPHNVAVEGNGVDEVSETITGSETSLTLTLEAGEYTFYCAVGNHRDAGMEGTLTVK